MPLKPPMVNIVSGCKTIAVAVGRVGYIQQFSRTRVNINISGGGGGGAMGCIVLFALSYRTKLCNKEL